jgi:protein-disulfide isomerase
MSAPFADSSTFRRSNKLKKHYIDTGQVRFVARDLPLDIHKHAMAAAHGARCAGEHGKYWEMRHVLIVNANRLGPEALPGDAADLALNLLRFQECESSGRFGHAIQRDIAEAQTLGITGTPSFVLGKTTGNAIDGIRVVGALPYAIPEAKIRELVGSR